jgi:hypothetical protein
MDIIEANNMSIILMELSEKIISASQEFRGTKLRTGEYLINSGRVSGTSTS